MSARPPIISVPQSIPLTRKGVEHAIVFVGWLAFAWFFLPLATLLVWVMGVQTLYLNVYLSGALFDPMLLWLLPFIALSCAATLVGWAEYNRWRFSNADRRKRMADLDTAQVAQSLNAPLELAQRLQSSRTAVVRLNAEGVLDGVRITHTL